MYSHKLIALIRVDVDSCGKEVGCVAEEEVVSVYIDEALDAAVGSVLGGMPKSAVVVPESTLSGVAILRRTRRAGSEHVVMNIAV